MKEQLINFETAKLAKEKRFNAQCFYYYKNGKLIEPYEENGSSTDIEFRVDLTDLLDNHNTTYSEKYSAPTQSLLQKWLREIHDIHIEIEASTDCELNVIIPYAYQWLAIKNGKYSHDLEFYDSFEECLEVALFESLKLVEL